MPEKRAFFVPPETPEFTPEMQEEAYAEFAALCERAVPKPAERIYSITYNHDGEEWTATVGERLRGVRYRSARSHGRPIEQVIRRSDPAIVLAIFPGNPFTVVTNHCIMGNVGSAWENPFYAGRPRSITYFSLQVAP